MPGMGLETKPLQTPNFSTNFAYNLIKNNREFAGDNITPDYFLLNTVF